MRIKETLLVLNLNTIEKLTVKREKTPYIAVSNKIFLGFILTFFTCGNKQYEVMFVMGTEGSCARRAAPRNKNIPKDPVSVRGAQTESPSVAQWINFRPVWPCFVLRSLLFKAANTLCEQ